MSILELSVATDIPDGVIYRLYRKSGTLVVKVFCRTTLPRVIFYIESLHDVIPTALFFEELTEFVEDAKRRVKERASDSL